MAIIEKYDDKKQRYQIKIEDTGTIIALKPQNLKQITDAFGGRALVEPPSRLRVVGTQATSLELEWDSGEGDQWQLQWSCDGGLTWESASRNLEAPKVKRGIYNQVRTSCSGFGLCRTTGSRRGRRVKADISEVAREESRSRRR